MNSPRNLMRFTRLFVLFWAICASQVTELNAADKTPPKVSAKESFRANDFRKIAILVSGSNKTDRYFDQPQSDQQRLVEDAFLGALIEKNFEVAVRSDLAKILKEQVFQNSGLTDSDSVKLGKLANVPAVMVVHISELTLGPSSFRPGPRGPTDNLRLATVSLGARLIEVSSGSVLWTGTHRVEAQVVGQRATEAIVQCAEELADVFPKRDASKAADKPEETADAPERGKRLNSSFVTGSVWEGTYSRSDEESRSTDVTWTIKERKGTHFVAEVQLPNRKLEITGTLSGGVLSWTQKGEDAKSGVEQSLRVRGDSITGKLKRPKAKEEFETNVILTRKK